MLASVPEERRASPQFQRAVDKMAHLVAARHNWLWRLGKWPERPTTFFPPGHTLESLSPYLHSIEGGWTAYLAGIGEAELLSEFEFTSSEGTRWRWNVMDLLTQVFGHAWYHRGQIALLVKDLGGKPVDTDYVFWCGTTKKLGAPAA